MLKTGNKRMFPRSTDRTSLKMDPVMRSEHENSRISSGQMERDQKTRFDAGMDESFAKRLKMKLMNKELFSNEVVPKQVLFVDSQGNRFERDKSGQYKHEVKDKFHSMDFALLSHDYDLRISCATETAAPSLDPSAAPVWSLERHKYRTTFQLLPKVFKADPRWKVDYTEVLVFDPTASSTSSGEMNSSQERHDYELEFELKPDALKKWISLHTSTPPPNITAEQLAEIQEKYCSELFSEFLFLLDYCIPSNMDTTNELELLPMTGPLRDSRLEEKVNHLNAKIRAESGQLGQSNRNSNQSMEFLGSMPINLFRSSLNIVLQSEYYVTEKTDGIRYLLYVLENPQQPDRHLAVFMDRSKTLFTFQLTEIIGNLLPKNTLLDGEIVFNHHRKQSVFLVFDVLAYNNDVLVNQPFSRRYETIERSIIATFQRRFKEICEKGFYDPKQTAPKYQIDLFYKKFVKKESLFELLKSFHFEHGERVYKETAASPQESEFLRRFRYHKSDGIIFQPNTAYKFGKYYDLLKWKWSDLRSIDLKVMITGIDRPSAGNASSIIPALYRVSNKEIYLYCTGPENTLIDISKRGDYNISLDPFDTGRLLAEMEEIILYQGIQKIQGMIIEVIYDVQVGKWIYSKIRKDKTEPNYIDSVLGVFIEQAEAISIDELEFTFLAAMKKLEMDFDLHVTKCRAGVVKWQRDRVETMNKQQQSSLPK